MNSNKLFRIVLIFFLIRPFFVSAQLEHIEFKNDFEKGVLTDIENHSSLEILFAISEDNSNILLDKASHEIDLLIEELSKKKFESKSEEKKLKLLFNLTHRKFFLKYREVSNFSKIFDVKEYNCVSATALYCLILDKYNIPYAIKETPTHVYAIAYPKTKGIILESTAPQDGFYKPSDTEINDAVNSLVELKYYTQDEVASKGVRQVYNEFFFSKDEIDLKKLAGLQYYNETITFLSEQKFKEALNSIYKAQFLYPSDKNEYLSGILLANILLKSKFDNLEDIQYLAQYANLSNADDNQILQTFSVITENRLFQESNTVFMDSAFSYLEQSLLDSTLVRNISELYYNNLAHYYGQKSNFKKTLEYASVAFKLNPVNVNTQSLITQILIQDLSRRSGNLNTIKKMDDYVIEYSFLETNSLYQSLYFYTYTIQAYNHLIANDIEKGLAYLKNMEELIENFGEELRYDENQYGLIYAEAGAAYFRERKYTKAKNIIEKGLVKIPEHPELKVRHKIVVEELSK
ncbi:hypothetical protein [Sediminitomix flava]|uniref:Tetratricopeptide repeat protein n=1 Tax=Sediminitomix flava TaxID=379075 RepID=A0A315ZGF6_SEDFL|nr:hypothetical protein [Sediminitomix flava]PWJ44200.1 hypothetical protein BC781_101550 [Sediminitomix flava]